MHGGYGFAVERLQEVWDAQTRKGRTLPQQLSVDSALEPNLRAIFDSFALAKTYRASLDKARKTGLNHAIEKARSDLRESLELRDAYINDYLQGVAIRMADPTFRVQITHRKLGDQTVFGLATPVSANFFAEKVLQMNLKEAYGLATTSRDLIIERLIRVLDDTHEKIVVRGDVHAFYESIPHDRLLDLLRKNPALSTRSITLITGILQQTGATIGQPRGTGLPRGLGVSAALSEIYMQEFDRAIKSLPETLFYARYVDDIVAVFSPEQDAHHHANDYLQLFEEHLTNLGLSLSSKQQKRYAQCYSKPNYELPALQLLGYTLTVSREGVAVRLSANRVRRLATKIDASFRAYELAIKRGANAYQIARAGSILSRRIRFLTSNTRLYNTKSLAHVGIFVSNRHLTELLQLHRLDIRLGYLAKTVTDTSLASSLRSNSFVTGFSHRTYIRWRPRQLEEITSLWSTHA